MHPVDLLALVSPISWDDIALRGVQAPTRAGRDGKRLNSTVYGYTFLLATLQRNNRVFPVPPIYRAISKVWIFA